MIKNPILYVCCFVLLWQCKSSQKVSHPSLTREDGYYYRQKNKNLCQFIRFYSNGRVLVNLVLVKEEDHEKYANKLICALDSTKVKKFPDIRMGNYLVKKDSIVFKIDSKDVLVKYNSLFSGKLYKDSLPTKITAVDYDTTTFKMKSTIYVTFKFVSASCDESLKIPTRNYETDQELLFIPN